jgi:hypothetical protein
MRQIPERCAGSRFERELARKPGATFATVSAAHAAFHRCKERLLQERKQLCASTVREFMVRATQRPSPPPPQRLERDTQREGINPLHQRERREGC